MWMWMAGNLENEDCEVETRNLKRPKDPACCGTRCNHKRGGKAADCRQERKNGRVFRPGRFWFAVRIPR